MISGLESLLQEEVSHAAFSANTSPAGDRSQNTYAAATTGIPARVTYTTQRILSSDGRLVLTDRVAWIDFADGHTMTSRDLITLPDASTPEILRYQQLKDEVGGSCWKVWFSGDA